MENNVAELVRQAVAGDQEAFHQLYTLYAQRIFSFILGMVRNREEAEDIAQDTFALVYHKLANLKDADKFEYWLYRIARNEVYQRFRRQRSQPKFVDSDEPTIAGQVVGRSPGALDPEDRTLNKELGQVLEHAMQTLPPKLKEVFILSVVQQKSYREITEIVDRSLLSVKTDIFRARHFAKDTIARYLTEGIGGRLQVSEEKSDA